MNELKPVSLANVRIGFRNFAGKEAKYNKEGDRNFVVFLDNDLASQMEKDGWNIKWPKERDFEADEEDQRNPYLPVGVSFDNFPAKVVLVSGDHTSVLSEDDVDMLDWIEMENVDLVIRPYHWSVNGNSGIKAYTKAIYVTMVTDDFSSKYGV